MRKSLVAALMVATALIPGAAMAQRGDGNGWRGARQADRAARVEARQAPTQAAAPRAQVQPQPQPRPQMQQRDQRPDGAPRFNRAERTNNYRSGGWNRDGQRGGQPNTQAAPVAPVAAQPTPTRQQRGHWRRGNAGAGVGADVRVNRGNDGRFDRGNNGVTNNVRRDDARRDNDRRNGNWRGNDNRGNDWRGNDNRGSDWRGGNRNNARDYRGNNGQRWNRNWRQDNRYDWSRRRQYNRNAFHLPRYYAPYGWNSGYRRFNIGFSLSSILFAQSYWLDDPFSYGLPEAYGQYRWVRYYNDALLVDIDTGEVVDTVYDIFW